MLLGSCNFWTDHLCSGLSSKLGSWTNQTVPPGVNTRDQTLRKGCWADQCLFSWSSWDYVPLHDFLEKKHNLTIQAQTVEYNTVYSVEMESLFPSNSLHLHPTSCSLHSPLVRMSVTCHATSLHYTDIYLCLHDHFESKKKHWRDGIYFTVERGTNMVDTVIK